MLLQIVAKLKGSSHQNFAPVSLDTSANSGRKVQESAQGFTLFVGKPGEECGHIVSASSYFDRLWAKEQSTDR